MPQLTVDLPAVLADRLERVAAAQNKSVEQVILDQLASVPEPSQENLIERYDQALRESGLLIEIPEEVKQRYKPVSEERLRELAAKLGAAGPLSEIIIEERGKR